MPPVMFSVVTKYHKGRHSLFLYNSEIFYAFTQDILRSHISFAKSYNGTITQNTNRDPANISMIPDEKPSLPPTDRR